MSWSDFRASLVESVGRELWAHWSALGVAGIGTPERRRVDLEALLVGTWTHGRSDPRLFDEALSWCCRHGAVVNVKRLEKLLAQLPDTAVLPVARAWDETLARHGTVSWGLHKGGSPRSEGTEMLFLTRDLLPQSAGPGHDETFLRWGLVRGPVDLREATRAPDFSHPSLAQLFCRKFVGSGCRAEVLALLMHDVGATTTELADMSVYSPRLVQETLRDFNDAGLLDWNPGPGRTTRPTLLRSALDSLRNTMAHPDGGRDWAGLYEQRDWPGFFLGLHRIWVAASRITRSELTGFKAQSVLRDALEEAVGLHTRTTIHPFYAPRLAANSLEALIGEAQVYLESLMPSHSGTG